MVFHRRRRGIYRRRFPRYPSSNLPANNRSLILFETYKHCAAWEGGSATENPFVCMNYDLTGKINNNKDTNNIDTHTLQLAFYYDSFRIDKIVHTIHTPEVYLYTFKPMSEVAASKSNFDNVRGALMHQFNYGKLGTDKKAFDLPKDWDFEVLRTYGDSIEYTYLHQTMYNLLDGTYGQEKPKQVIHECNPLTYTQRKKKLHKGFRMHVAWRPNMKYAVPIKFMQNDKWEANQDRKGQKKDFNDWCADFNIRRAPTLFYIRPVFQMGMTNGAVYDEYQITCKIIAFKITRKIYISVSNRNKMACVK